jgi:hypothetical protein
VNRTALTTALVLAAVTACADQGTVTAPQMARAAKGAAAPAPQGGAILERRTERFFSVLTSDQEHGLTTALGATLADIAEDCAGGFSENDATAWQTVAAPSGRQQWLVKGDDVTVLVWAGFYDPSVDFCAFVAATPLLAVGTADYTLTVHLGAPAGGPGATKINLRAQGKVTDLGTGQRLHYVVRSGSLVTGGGTDKGFDNHILLTPIGG